MSVGLIRCKHMLQRLMGPDSSAPLRAFLESLSPMAMQALAPTMDGFPVARAVQHLDLLFEYGLLLGVSHCRRWAKDVLIHVIRLPRNNPLPACLPRLLAEPGVFRDVRPDCLYDCMLAKHRAFFSAVLASGLRPQEVSAACLQCSHTWHEFHIWSECASALFRAAPHDPAASAMLIEFEQWCGDEANARYRLQCQHRTIWYHGNTHKLRWLLSLPHQIPVSMAERLLLDRAHISHSSSVDFLRVCIEEGGVFADPCILAEFLVQAAHHLDIVKWAVEEFWWCIPPSLWEACQSQIPRTWFGHRPQWFVHSIQRARQMTRRLTLLRLRLAREMGRVVGAHDPRLRADFIEQAQWRG